MDKLLQINLVSILDQPGDSRTFKMVQGKIVRQPKKVIDRETLQHLAEQQHKAIDAVTADLYHDQLAAKQPIPKAIEHSWCITRVSEPVAVEPQ